VDTGNITQRITATGTVSPMVQVSVGTQVSGVISSLSADYNSLVKKGQIIAQIDPTIWEAQLNDSEASLQRAQATYDNAKLDYGRTKRLAAEKLVSDAELDLKSTSMKTASGNLESAKASLVRAKANLAYCNITAPVDGVIIARLADVGQTVAASFSTPNLFSIAQDLSKMKVETSIDESDIAGVKVGQDAFFTVDSLQDKQFRARVSQIRLEPITTQNVVTYKVVMEVPNEPLPGTESTAAQPESGAAGPRHNSPGGKPKADGDRAQGDRPMGERDPEKAWERMKDRLPEGMTKEKFLQRFKERAAQHGTESGSRGPRTREERPTDRQAARTPGGIQIVGGPVFAGNLALRPGMTANVTIITNKRADVLKVPNAALRFNPAAFTKDEKAPEAQRPGGQGGTPGGMMGGQRPAGGGRGQGGQARGMVARREDRVWILENDKPKAITVKAGISDGQSTEVTGEGIKEGMMVLVGAEDLKKTANRPPAPVGGMSGGRR
jgi:RND family efflux transporter MFP subunit